MICRHYRMAGLREEDALLDDTHGGRLPQFPPAPLSQIPSSLGHLPAEIFQADGQPVRAGSNETAFPKP